MFFDLYLLRSQGQFSLIWIAATRGVNRLQSGEIKNLDVERPCNDILQRVMSNSSIPSDRLSLSLSARLLSGVIRIYHRKVIVLFEDVCKVLQTVRKPLWFLPPEKPKKKRTKKSRTAAAEDAPVVPQLVPEATPAVPQLGYITDADISRILEHRDPNIMAEARHITMPEVTETHTRQDEEHLEFGLEPNLEFIDNITSIIPEERRLTTEATIEVPEAGITVPRKTLLEPTVEKPRQEPMDLDLIETVPEAEAVVAKVPAAKETTPIPKMPAAKETPVREMLPEKRSRFVLPKIGGDEIVIKKRKDLNWRVDDDSDLIKDDDPKIDFADFKLYYIPSLEVNPDFLALLSKTGINVEEARGSLENLRRSSDKLSSLKETPVLIPEITISKETPTPQISGTLEGTIIPPPEHPIARLRRSSTLRGAARSPVPIQVGESVPQQGLTPAYIRDGQSEIGLVQQRVQFQEPAIVPQDIIVPQEIVVPQETVPQEIIQERVQIDEPIIPQVQETIQERSLTEEEIKINRRKKLKEMVHLIENLHKGGKAPITIDDVADKPLTKKSITVAFSHLLELHKSEYIELKSKESSCELSHIVLGKKLKY